MSHQEKSYKDKHRRMVLSGQSPEKLNGRLRSACARKWDDAVIEQVVESFKDKKDIDYELIVSAAQFGRVGMTDILTRALPVSEETQKYYDRALIAAAIDHLAPQQQYRDIVQMLLERGADPEAYDCVARQMASGHNDKKEIFFMIEAAIDAAEDARAAKAVPAAKFSGNRR